MTRAPAIAISGTEGNSVTLLRYGLESGNLEPFAEQEPAQTGHLVAAVELDRIVRTGSGEIIQPL